MSVVSGPELGTEEVTGTGDAPIRPVENGRAIEKVPKKWLRSRSAGHGRLRISESAGGCCTRPEKFGTRSIVQGTLSCCVRTRGWPRIDYACLPGGVGQPSDRRNAPMRRERT